MKSFLVWTLKNWGHSVSKNAISRQNFANFMLKLPQKWWSFQNVHDLYVKFDTKVEKGVIGCGLNKKGGHWVWDPGMDKVRERGASLPGNVKVNWGNRHTGIWRKKEEEEREEEEKKKRRKEKRKKKKEKRKKEKSGRNWGTYKLQRKSMVMMNLNQALKGYEWGKLGWHWNNRNEEECKEKRRRRIGEEIAGSEMEEKRRKEKRNEK